MTKAELMKKYRQGEFDHHNKFIYAHDWYNTVIIVYADDEKVFGFKEYSNPLSGDIEKTFFKRKLYYDNDITYFTIDNYKYDLNDFINYNLI